MTMASQLTEFQWNAELVTDWFALSSLLMRMRVIVDCQSMDEKDLSLNLLSSWKDVGCLIGILKLKIDDDEYLDK